MSMQHYKVYYQFYKFGGICLSSIEYSSKLDSKCYQFYRELEESIALIEDIKKGPRGYEVTISGVYSIDPKTVETGKKVKLQEIR